MSETYQVETIRKIPVDYTYFDMSDKEGEEIFIIGKEGQISKVETRVRFRLPLVLFDKLFISAMYKLISDKKSPAFFNKLVISEDNKVGFISIKLAPKIKKEVDGQDSECPHENYHIENLTSGSICDDCGEEL